MVSPIWDSAARRPRAGNLREGEAFSRTCLRGRHQAGNLWVSPTGAPSQPAALTCLPLQPEAKKGFCYSLHVPLPHPVPFFILKENNNKRNYFGTRCFLFTKKK